MARQAFRNSIGATEDDAVSFDHKEYTVLDLNFLWHFKMLIEEETLEKAAKACEKVGDDNGNQAADNEAYDCAASIRGMK